MIIELFGPPCAGKTTLASAVASRLREGGRSARLVLSYRPGEYPPTAGNGGATRLRIPAAVHRLIRPAVESIAAAARSADRNEAAVEELMRLVGSKNIVRSLRLRQYLFRLCRTWDEAIASGDIVLFDQAFVQAVSSAVATPGVADPERIGRALDALPEADLLIRLQAPPEVLKARLAERWRRQGRIERLFDTWADVESLHIFDLMHELLQQRGRPVTCIDSADRRSLNDGVKRVGGLVMGRNESPVQAGCGAGISG